MGDIGERIFYIYYLRRPDKDDPLWPGAGQPFYVGKGNNGRINVHRKEAEKLLYKPGRKTYKINIIHFLWKQGLDFKEEIMFSDLTEQEAFDLEIEAIEVYGRIDLGIGHLVNMTDGGDGISGFNHSEETKQKISDAHKGKPKSEETKEKMRVANKGKVLTEETIKKMKQTHKGHKTSQETKEKISQGLKGRKHTEEAKEKMRGRKHTEEAKEKMRGRKRTEEHKEKLRQAHYGKPPSSEQTRRKIAESMKKYWADKQQRGDI